MSREATMRVHNMSGKEKAAVLLVSLGPDVASQIYRHLKDEEIENLTREIADMNSIKSEVRDEVFDEFNEMYMAREYVEHGGIDYAREILEKALGASRAEAILNRLTSTLKIRPFSFARKTDAGQLLNFIQNEHP